MRKQDRCGDCKFWERYNEKSVRGECHAMPPAMLGQINMPEIGIDRIAAVWPQTPDSQWCGKFELSDEASFRRAEKFRQRMIDMRSEGEK